MHSDTRRSAAFFRTVCLTRQREDGAQSRVKDRVGFPQPGQLNVASPCSGQRRGCAELPLTAGEREYVRLGLKSAPAAEPALNEEWCRTKTVATANLRKCHH